MNKEIYIKKANGGLEPFDKIKLVESLERVGVDTQTTNAIVAEVITEIEDGMTTGEIYRKAFHILRKRSMPDALKYSLRRALSELGPDGFPFEKFIASLLEARGYKTLVDQVVQGNCVQHDVDIVAWKDGDKPENDELIMVEAKFHNEFGLKSDLKVALYIKARFDDLSNGVFRFGGKDRKLTAGWLVTNTKFTEQAIKYGECTGLAMIGWNYPAKGNLHDLIEESKLHPSTCLATLTNADKKGLLSHGVILCRDISADPGILDKIGMDENRKSHVMKEIGEVCGI